MADSRNWALLSADKRKALEMVQHKIARIKQPQLPTESVGTKVTDAPYAMLKAVAGDQKLGDW